MIRISLAENYISLSGDIASLKYYQLPLHFGYSEQESIYVKKYSHNSLISIVEFYKNEKIKVELSDEVKKIVNEYNQSKSDFESLIKTARLYKDGKYNNEDFVEFTTFLNSNLTRKLRNHQIKATYHLYLVKNGANFSVPGSGKTSVVIAAFKKFVSEGLIDHMFVIGPASSAKPWKDEYENTIGRSPNFIKLSGLNKVDRKLKYYGTYSEETIFFATYNTAYNDKRYISDLLGLLNNRAMLILDEAHYIKRLGGEWAEAVLYLSKYANMKCILTGTPIPRDYTDIFNMVEFLWLEQSPINSEIKNKISISSKKVAGEILNNTIGPITYRVRKKELNLLTPIFHPNIKIDQNKIEKSIYKLIYKNIKNLADNDRIYEDNINLLYSLWRARLIRLRQALSYPKLISTAIENYSENLIQNDSIEDLIINYDKYELPAKIEKLISLVKTLRSKNQKILIWSNFIGTIDLILVNIRSYNIKTEKIVGSVPSEIEGYNKDITTREKIIDNFLNKDIEVLIANPAACAESISLHSNCFHAIYYDLSYNLAQYLQSLDRIHRVGGSEKNIANYYFLQYRDTMEHKIKRNLDIKKNKMYDIIEQDFAIYDLYMDQQDDIENIQDLMK